MTIQEALDHLQNEQALLVNNFTFEPDTIDHAILTTGDSIYWIRNDSGRWLSVDVASDELILFEDVEEEVEPGEGLVVLRNKDYEFSSEGSGRLVDEEGVELETMSFKDYEAEGEVVRITESDVTGDRTVSIGLVIADDEVSQA